jgi:hypothetical protein
MTFSGILAFMVHAHVGTLNLGSNSQKNNLRTTSFVLSARDQGMLHARKVVDLIVDIHLTPPISKLQTGT